MEHFPLSSCFYLTLKLEAYLIAFSIQRSVKYQCLLTFHGMLAFLICLYNSFYFFPGNNAPLCPTHPTFVSLLLRYQPQLQQCQWETLPAGSQRPGLHSQQQFAGYRSLNFNPLVGPKRQKWHGKPLGPSATSSCLSSAEQR